MSTTGGGEAGTVYVLDEPDADPQEVPQRAVTDSGREVRRGEGKEGIANLIDILSVVRGVDARARSRPSSRAPATATSRRRSATRSPSTWRPVRERYAELRDDQDGLERALAAGAEQARAIAAPARSPTSASAMGVAEPG